jgi:hypothetical protein
VTFRNSGVERHLADAGDAVAFVIPEAQQDLCIE